MEELNNCFKDRDDEISAIKDVFKNIIDSKGEDPIEI